MQVGSMFFSDIRIIQSLEAGERHTGTERYDTLKYYPWKKGNEKLEVMINDVTTVDDLKRVFADIKGRLKNQNRLPVIHLEIHGADDKSGLVLSSGDYIPWSDLVKDLVEINILTHNSLILVMGVCYGSYIGLDAISRTFTDSPRHLLEGRSAFTQLVASNLGVTDEQISSAFRDFYEHLLSDDFNPDNLLINRFPGLFSISTMESFANYLIAGVKSMIESPHFKLASKSELNRRRLTNPASIPKLPSHLQLEWINKQRAAHYKSELQKMRDRYLMIDLFPHNKKRFMPFEKAWRTQGPQNVDISSLFLEE